jgi:hypothetical protein
MDDLSGPSIPAAGELHTVRLDGGALDGEHRLVTSRGAGLDHAHTFEVDGVEHRYISRGVGHFTPGRSVWSYVYEDPDA